MRSGSIRCPRGIELTRVVLFEHVASWSCRPCDRDSNWISCPAFLSRCGTRAHLHVHDHLHTLPMQPPYPRRRPVGRPFFGLPCLPHMHFEKAITGCRCSMLIEVSSVEVKSSYTFVTASR